MIFLTYFRGVGRPLLDIDVTYIEYLRGLRFTFTDIAKMMGISRATIYRRLDDAGIDHACTYSNITDAALDQVVQTIKQVHPNDGERLMAGHLASRGIIVQRARLRGSIHRTDPENTAIRRSIAVRRRVYNVDGPNSLWHIDGHHKLIRWKFVTHGAIDGYSRTITYLKCADNNRASTVLSAFVEAAHIHGLPERIRSDHGGENIEVWRFMVEQHGSASSVITGSSTHNERIERLWRDVYRCVASIFYEMFFSLENEGKLNPGNEIDLYCLHFVYLPRINSALESFIESWNNHPISTERNNYDS
jgi:AcrR family transcriptional regulator